ncbi:MAG: antibiotic biosynthesis monooxygenase family protein [Pseudomonadota bacterium]
MKLEKLIMRVFEVRSKPGKSAALKEKLAATSVAVVADKPGNMGYFFGSDMSSDGNDLVFVSVWNSMEAVKAHFGSGWKLSFLPPGYEALIERCSVRHIEIDGRLSAAIERALL